MTNLLRDTDTEVDGDQLVADELPAAMTGQRVDVALMDGTRYRITTTNADRVRFDLTAPKHKWPTAQAAPFLWFTFLAWSASKREQRTALTFEQFHEQTVACEAVDVDEAVDGVRPTRPGRD